VPASRPKRENPARAKMRGGASCQYSADREDHFFA
jgi:hypothetical protein